MNHTLLILIRSISTLILALGLTTILVAQEWTGAADNNWNNPANWNEWPLDDEDLTIDPSLFTGAMAAPVISANSVFVPERVFVVNGAALVIQANLTLERFLIEGDGAVVNMNDGILTTERLIAESGGVFTMNNGTVNVLSLVALGDDEIGSSGMIMNGGTMNVTGEFGFDVVLEESQPYFELNGGTLTVNGEAVWYSEAPGAGRGRVLVNGGTAVINGPVYSNPGGPLEMQLEVNGGTLTINGPIVDLTHATDSLVTTGGELHLAGNMVIENDGAFHAEGGEVFFEQQTELRGIGTYRFHDITIAAGATLEHADPSEIHVSGDWVNMGSFDPHDNTVAFVGGSGQELDATTFHSMRIANSGNGVELNGPCTVAGGLILENGNVETSNTNMLTLLDGATSTSGSAASYVAGPMRKIGADDFVFPVGAGGKWRRIGISGIDDSDSEFTAQYIAAPYANTTSLGPLLLDVSNTEHWTLERFGSTDNAMVELHWENASESGISDCENVVVAHWDGNAWQANGSTTSGGCSGNAAGAVTTDEEVEVFGVFTIGTTSSPVGVAEMGSADKLMYYDAVHNAIRIDVAASQRTLMVFDTRGAVLYQQHVRPYEDHIAMPTMPAALYSAVLYSNDHAERLKFVVTE